MKILRLSMFNLKKKKKEAIAIAFLTMITTLMLAVFMTSQPKMNSSFDNSFEASGSPRYGFAVNYDKYRDDYKSILENTQGVYDVREEECIGAFSKDVLHGDETLSYTLVLVTEKTEKKLEDFVKREHLPEEEIAKLSHPIWLPVYFNIARDFKPGDTFTVVIDNIHYDFEIAGFYETGLMSSTSYGFKCVVSPEDYALFDMLLKGNIDGKKTLLWFSCDEEFSFTEYFKQCTESSGENLDSDTWDFCFDYEKSQTLQFLKMFMYLLAFFSAVTLLSALFVINHRISNDIEDQMQQIGVLEALGYRSAEISLSYVGEYLICAGIGSVLGGIIAMLVEPAMDKGIQGMMGRTVNSTVEIPGLLLAAVTVTLFVIAIALIKAAKVKKYPPVVAFRKGIRTHHFGRNMFPLEKSKVNINLTLAIKSFMGDLRSAFGVILCIVISGTAILFCANAFDLFKDGVDGMIAMAGTDMTVNVELMKGVDPYTVKNEIEQMPEVRKVLLSYTDMSMYMSVKGSEYAAWAQVYDDYNDAENIHVIEGRFPQHDNEVMITVVRSRAENINIGDSIVLEGNGMENKYIVTGMSSSLINSGMGIYLTTEGYLRTEFNAQPRSLSVYLADGVDQETFEENLYALYGKSAKDSPAHTDTGSTLEERIHNTADEKLAALVSYYGVTNADYAIVVGDKVITGNSRGFVIKEVSSFMGLAKQSLGTVAVVSKIGSAVAVIVIAIVVAVILALIVSSTVKRQRRSLGIMKGMGYSSKDLMIQLTMKTMPVTVISVAAAMILTKAIYPSFWLMVSGSVISISLPVTILTGIALVIFCYAVTYICTGKVKAISVTELMTE